MKLSSSAPDLFSYKPERLTLTGFRCAMAGYDHGDPSCWDDLWQSYVNDGGLNFACNAMGSLQYFVRSLRAGAPQAAEYYPRSCQRVCRHECLVLALVSAQQHRTPKVSAYALQHLLIDNVAEHCESVVASASLFASALDREGFKLLPIPLSVIQPIMETPQCPASCIRNLH
jgi:hypothetical protein